MKRSRVKTAASLAALLFAAGGLAACTGDDTSDAVADRVAVLYARNHIDHGDGATITLRDGEQSGIATLTWTLNEPMDATVKLRMPDPLDYDAAAGSGFAPSVLTWKPGETGERTTAITTSKALLNRDATYGMDGNTWKVWVNPTIESGNAKLRLYGVAVNVTREPLHRD